MSWTLLKSFGSMIVSFVSDCAFYKSSLQESRVQNDDIIQPALEIQLNLENIPTNKR